MLECLCYYFYCRDAAERRLKMDFATKILTAPLGKTYIFSVGQAGYIIKSKKGTLLGIDMYLTDCVERVEGHVGFKRLTPKVLLPTDIEFDYVLATHPHYDHFDMDAVPVLMSNPHTKLIASVNCLAETERLLMKQDNITYVKPGDVYEADDIRLDIVFCDHGTGAPDAFGLVISVDGKKIYMAGDTCLRKDLLPDIKAMGPFDVVIGPINGAYGNLNESEFVTVCELLAPALAIPCHFGTFASHGGNPQKFRDEIETRIPEQKYLLMAQCEQYIL